MLRFACLVLVLSCCLGGIGSAAAGEPRKGDVVVVSKGTSYVHAEVIELKAPFLKVKEKGSNHIFTTQLAFVLTPEEGFELLPEKTPVKVGDTFRAKWANQWSGVKVVEVVGKSVKVKWDEWPSFQPSDVAKIALARRKSAKKGSGQEAVSPELAGLAGKRTWTDASGKFKIEASFAGLSDEKVQLKKTDGKTIALPLEKLSTADREIAQLLAKSQPAGEPEDVDPFAMAAKDDGAGSSKPATTEEPADSDDSTGDPEFKTVTADWSEAFEVSLRSAGEFKIPDASLTWPPVKFADRSITLAASPDATFERPLNVIASPSLKRMLVVLDEGRPGSTNPYRFDLCDTEQGKMLGTYKFPGKFLPLAFDDTTKRVFTYTEGWPPGKDHHADVWEIDEKTTTVKHLLRWNPTEETRFGSGPTVRKAHWVNDDYALIIESTGRFTLWQLSKAKAIYFGQLPGDNTDVQFTPDGKYFMAVVQGALGIFEAATGKGVGQARLPATLGNAWRVSPDGKRLATISPTRTLQIFDIASNQLLHEVFMPSNVPAPSVVDWAGNSHVLVDYARLVDPALGVVVWNYTRTGTSSAYGGNPLKSWGGLFWGVKGESRSGQRCSLISAALPHPGVKDAVSGLDPQNLILFQPGVKVRLDLQTPTLAAADQEKIIASLTQALGEVGATVAPDGELVMTCVSKTGKPEAVAFGRGFGFRQTITDTTVFTPNSYSVEIKDPKGVIWSSWLTTSPPSTIPNKPGVTVESFVQEASKPSPDFFLKIKFPKGMKRPGPYRGAYGESQL